MRCRAVGPLGNNDQSASHQRPIRAVLSISALVRLPSAALSLAGWGQARIGKKPHGLLSAGLRRISAVSVATRATTGDGERRTTTLAPDPNTSGSSTLSPSLRVERVTEATSCSTIPASVCTSPVWPFQHPSGDLTLGWPPPRSGALHRTRHMPDCMVTDRGDMCVRVAGHPFGPTPRCRAIQADRGRSRSATRRTRPRR